MRPILPLRCLTAACGLALALQPLLAKHPWLRVQSRDVTLLTDGPKKAAVNYVVDYSAFRHVFNVLLAPNGRRPPPVQVVLFRSIRSLHDYCGDSSKKSWERTSLTTEIDGRSLVAIAISDNLRESLQSAYEFDTMWNLQRVGYNLPLWMAQGTGEVLATLQVKKDRCIVGRTPSNFNTLLYDVNWFTWSHLSGITTASPEYSTVFPSFYGIPNRSGLFFAQSWALMHWVLLGDPGHGRDRFARLAAEVQQTTEADTAAATALHLKRASNLLGAVRRNLDRNVTTEIPFGAVAIRSQISVAPATEVEVDIPLSVLARTAGNKIKAESLFDRAQRLAPDAPMVKETLARRALRQDNRDEAVQLYREAIAAGSTDPTAYLESATMRLDDASGGHDEAGAGGLPTMKAITEIRRAIALDPENSAAYVLLGRALFLAPRLKPTDVDELTPGVTESGDGFRVRYFRALLLGRLGQNEKSLAEFRAIAGDPRAPKSVRDDAKVRSEMFRFRAVRRQVLKRVAAREFRDALHLIDQAMSAHLQPDTLREYRAFRAWVAERAELAQLVTEYRAKQWAAFHATAIEFLKRFPRSPMAGKIRALIHEVAVAGARGATRHS